MPGVVSDIYEVKSTGLKTVTNEIKVTIRGNNLLVKMESLNT